MTIEYWICPAPLLLQPCDTMRPFDAPCGPEQCHVETEWMISVAKYIFYRIKKIFWQCSDIIVRIVRFHREWPDCQHRGSQWPHTITETIRFLLTMRKHSSIYFSPTVLHTLTVPPEYARLNLDSAEKSKQDQLSGTCPAKGSGTPPSSSEPVFETDVRFLYSNTPEECLIMKPSMDSSFGNWKS